MNSRPKVLVPAMFPTTNPPSPVNAALMPTASSGVLVPLATNVSPMTSGDMLRRRASVAPLRTSISAPPTKARRPSAHQRIAAVKACVSAEAPDMRQGLQGLDEHLQQHSDKELQNIKDKEADELDVLFQPKKKW